MFRLHRSDKKTPIKPLLRERLPGPTAEIKRELNQGQGEGRREAQGEGGRNPREGKPSASPRVAERSFPSRNGTSLSAPCHGSTAPALACAFRNMLLILGIFFPTALRHLSPPRLEAFRGRVRKSLADPFHPLTEDPANAPAWLSALNSSLLLVGCCSGSEETRDRRRGGTLQPFASY